MTKEQLEERAKRLLSERAMLEEQMQEHLKQAEQLANHLRHYNGALQECEYWLGLYENEE